MSFNQVHPSFPPILLSLPHFSQFHVLTKTLILTSTISMIIYRYMGSFTGATYLNKIDLLSPASTNCQYLLGME